MSDSSTVLGDACLMTDRDGYQWRDFSCMYPQLAPAYLDVERNYDPSEMMEWMSARWSVPFATVALYILAIGWGRSYMNDQKAWHWRPQLAVWNLLLCLFSAWGTARCVPHLLHNFAHMSLRDNFCIPARSTVGGGSTGLWILLFTWSKFPELGDTFFIIIHKKPLMFLHYYHHVTVLLYCWHCYVTNSIPGIIFVTMNFLVHALMYCYYFLMAIRMKPKWFNPMVITILQLSQMVVGVVITLVGFYYLKTDPGCAIGVENTNAGFLLYGSYLLLFFKFFVDRYLKKKSGAKAKKL